VVAAAAVVVAAAAVAVAVAAVAVAIAVVAVAVAAVVVAPEIAVVVRDDVVCSVVFSLVPPEKNNKRIYYFYIKNERERFNIYIYI